MSSRNRHWLPGTALALALLFGSASPATSAAPADARVWIYQYLLATATTERELAPITEHIIDEKALHRADLLDFAAEVLLARIGDPAFPLQNKLRLIRVLAAAKSPRYNGVLTSVAGLTTSNDARKEARSAIHKKKTAAESYRPGTADIRAIVAEVDASALAAKPTTAQGEHLAKFPGGTFEELFEWAGKPQQIVSGQTRVSDGILIHIKIQRVTFFYRGLGRVVYGYNGSKKVWLFQAVVADPLAFEQEFSYRDRARELGLPDDPSLEMIQLVSGYTASIRRAVEKNYLRETRPPEFMDSAAEILATRFEAANDPVEIDMLAWICRLLSKHDDQRYAALLSRVTRDAQELKLSRYAERSNESGKKPAKSYIPGAISLAAQRAKYPSLYPDSTFQHGRL
jgi:hypothetical protein